MDQAGTAEVKPMRKMLRLEYERRRRCLSQTEVGRAVGCTHVFLSQVENGRLPGRALAQRIADFLGLPSAESVIEEVL